MAKHKPFYSSDSILSAQDECVSSNLSKKLEPGQKPSDQDLAIAFSECQEKKASNALSIIKVKLAQLRLDKDAPEVDEKQLEIGTKEELEHTHNEDLARSIAKDHLIEHPDYYEKYPEFLETLQTREAQGKYLTASLDTKFVQNPEKQGKFASYFLLKGDEINGREWGVTSESIPKNINSFIGKPLVATGEKFVEDSPYGVNYLHPSISHFIGKAPELVAGLSPMNMDDIMSFQDRFRIGTIEDVFFDSDKNLWNAVVKLAQGVEASDLPPFCSPAIYQNNMAESEGNITQWTGLHLAALDQRPAYGNIALLNGTCSGTTGQCKTQFAGSANALKSDVMRIATMLSTENRSVDKVSIAKKKKRNY